MDALRLIVFGVVGAGIWVLWRRRRYPGGWAFAFSFTYEEDRDCLANARNRARDAARRATQAESAARGTLADYERRQHQLEQQIARLRNPGTGEQLSGLGELVLFRHLLVVTSETGTRSVPLAALDVRFDMGQRNHSIYLTEASGRVHRAAYPHLLPATDDQQQFDEDTVRDFAVAIQNAIADENAFRARIPTQLKRTEKELEDTRADTRAQEAARERLAQVRQRNRQDPHRRAADAALEEARKDWETLTGHIPPA
ncbi:hypothetical protein [Streptomyces tauricus]|uniref:hypothetical protein n=1 Tax=Streptomyces tauricus TaxID=68274 RepID=UPI00224307E5|nr:hypothetical protein [Streptomyces tauricus]MCW8102643.1 hypothetical protein [Streptomyces tauricus]